MKIPPFSSYINLFLFLFLAASFREATFLNGSTKRNVISFFDFKPIKRQHPVKTTEHCLEILLYIFYSAAIINCMHISIRTSYTGNCNLFPADQCLTIAEREQHIQFQFHFTLRSAQIKQILIRFTFHSTFYGYNRRGIKLDCRGIVL